MSRSSQRTEQRDIKFVKIDSSTQLKEEFEFGHELGKGAFGSVLLAVRLADGQKFAVKKLAKQRDSRSTYGKSWEIEIRVMRRFQHENMIKLEVIYESENNCYLFLEYCDAGTLNDELKRRDKFSESDTKCLLRQLGAAISFLHRHRVAHRDLKLQNCLLKSNPSCTPQHNQHSHPKQMRSSSVDQQLCQFHLRLTDFGLSIELKDVEYPLVDNVGTPIFQAPEIVTGKSYTFKCDVWSFGIVFYWMLHGVPPYTFRDESELSNAIKNYSYSTSSCCCGASCQVCAGLSQQCKHALNCLLVTSPVDRWSASEFMASGWITEQQQTSDSDQQTNSILDMMRNFNAQQHK